MSWIATSLLGVGVGGAALGGMFGGGGSNKTEYDEYLPSMSPEHQQLYNQGQQYMQGGFPEFANLASTQWRNETFPGIRELYEGRRGLGIGSTPENLGAMREQSSSAANAAAMQAQARQQMYNSLMGLVRQPAIGVTPAGPSGFENLLSFATPIASSFAQGQGLQGLLSQFGLGAAQRLKPPLQFNPSANRS